MGTIKGGLGRGSKASVAREEGNKAVGGKRVRKRIKQIPLDLGPNQLG